MRLHSLATLAILALPGAHSAPVAHPPAALVAAGRADLPPRGPWLAKVGDIEVPHMGQHSAAAELHMASLVERAVAGITPDEYSLLEAIASNLDDNARSAPVKTG